LHYLAEGASKFWLEISPELATAVSIPVIAIATAFSLRHMRRRLNAATAEE
jgi:uncharacterized membrane-anchored protein